MKRPVIVGHQNIITNYGQSVNNTAPTYPQHVFGVPKHVNLTHPIANHHAANHLVGTANTTVVAHGSGKTHNGKAVIFFNGTGNHSHHNHSGHVKFNHANVTHAVAIQNSTNHTAPQVHHSHDKKAEQSIWNSFTGAIASVAGSIKSVIVGGEHKTEPV